MIQDRGPYLIRRLDREHSAAGLFGCGGHSVRVRRVGQLPHQVIQPVRYHSAIGVGCDTEAAWYRQPTRTHDSEVESLASNSIDHGRVDVEDVHDQGHKETIEP